jgi:hypothetical protein
LRRDRYRTFRAARVGDAEKDGEEEEENGARHGFEGFSARVRYARVLFGNDDRFSIFQKVKKVKKKEGDF